LQPICHCGCKGSAASARGYYFVDYYLVPAACSSVFIHYIRREKWAMLRRFYQNELIEAGCDEAGRGSFAGPVFAAAVILPKKFRHPF